MAPVANRFQQRPESKVLPEENYLTVINNLVEEMVLKLKAIAPHKLLRNINPDVMSTVLSGAKCYAIKRNEGFQFLTKKGTKSPSKEKVEAVITKNKLGELNVNRNFLNKGTLETKIKKKNSKKWRSVIFRRSLVGKKLRESLDKLLQYKSPDNELDETLEAEK